MEYVTVNLEATEKHLKKDKVAKQKKEYIKLKEDRESMDGYIIPKGTVCEYYTTGDSFIAFESPDGQIVKINKNVVNKLVEYV